MNARPIGVRKGVDFQFTGAVRKVDAAALSAQLDVADIVLVPFVGYSPTGEVFNLAWEDVAENVAVALKADKLLMYTDKLPTNRKGEVVSELTADEALALADRTEYGLAATVLTRSPAHAQRAARELAVGTVKINAVFGGAPGGAAEPARQSGSGFGYGPELLDEMTTTKVVHVSAPPPR